MSEDQWQQQSLRELVSTLREMTNSDEGESLVIWKFLAHQAELPTAYSRSMLKLARTVNAWLVATDLGDLHVTLPPAAGAATLAALTVRAQAPASAEVSSPATETQGINYQNTAMVLLCVIAWLIIFAVPAYAYKSGWSSDAQAMADGYDALIAGIAVTITAAILAKHKRK